jgi:hypothetical protein
MENGKNLMPKTWTHKGESGNKKSGLGSRYRFLVSFKLFLLYSGTTGSSYLSVGNNVYVCIRAGLNVGLQRNQYRHPCRKSGDAWMFAWTHEKNTENTIYCAVFVPLTGQSISQKPWKGSYSDFFCNFFLSDRINSGTIRNSVSSLWFTMESHHSVNCSYWTAKTNSVRRVPILYPIIITLQHVR